LRKPAARLIGSSVSRDPAEAVVVGALHCEVATNWADDRVPPERRIGRSGGADDDAGCEADADEEGIGFSAPGCGRIEALFFKIEPAKPGAVLVAERAD